MSLEPAASPSSVSRQLRQSIAEVLARYGLDLAGEPQAVPDSVLNENFRVPTSGGDRFVRLHRKAMTRARLEIESAVRNHASAAGIPVASPLADPQGRVVHVLSSRMLSVYPWVEGQHFRRGDMTAAEARLMGDLHGRVHQALRDSTDPQISATGTGSSWDLAEALDVLGRVDDLIRYYPATSPEQLRLQEAIRNQMDLLQSAEPRPASDFAHLPRQCCHGDFHERNVIVDGGGKVQAVVDWEMAGRLPPVFELLRAMSFMELWEPVLSSAYLTGYRTHAQVEDVEACVEMWWQAQLHSTWVYRARFIEGIHAAARFLEPHWAMLERLSDPAYRAGLVSAVGG